MESKWLICISHKYINIYHTANKSDSVESKQHKGHIPLSTHKKCNQPNVSHVSRLHLSHRVSLTHTNLFSVAGEEQRSCLLSQSTQACWVMVLRKHNPKQTPQVHHKPVNVSNQYSPLSSTPPEKTTLIICSLIVRNLKLDTPGKIFEYILGDREVALNPILNF